MKKTIIITVCLIISFFTVSAQSANVKNSAKSVFTLTTFAKDGSIISSTHGVFTDKNGEAISSWTPFIGASKAVVIDVKGNKMEVESIMGANELYDVCKFRVNGKTTISKLSPSASIANDKVWLLGYSEKNPSITPITIKSVEKFMNKYSYYILDAIVPENADDCPIINQNGQVIGLLQHSKTNDDVFATDANFINSFKTTGLSINDHTLRQCNIRVALPENQQDALLTLMIAGQQNDSLHYTKYSKEFIDKFPSMPDGYTSLAQIETNAANFDNAAIIMENAIKTCTKKDEVHSNYAKIILQKEIYMSDKPYTPWSLDKALSEAQQAYTINPLPAYQHQQAQIIFSKREYQKAYDMFIALTKTPLRNGEVFYEASQCKKQLGAQHKEIIALLDSAIAVCPQPLTSVAAPYVLARGVEWEAAAEYRNAVNDYNQYDSLMYGRPISSQFYYTREQCEIKIHQYQQAINDITRAIIMTPNEPTYWAEKASVHLRVSQFPESIKSSQRCIQLAPEYSDGYLILGIAQIQSKDKENGLKNLLKAQELGNTQAEGLIKKYK